MKELLPRITGALPWGWQQRLSLACANLHRPEILFLDEPTGSVDPVSRRTFWDYIYTLSQQGTTVFVTTHHMDEAEYCNRISIMVAGRIAAIDSPANLKKQQNAQSLQEAFIRIVTGKAAAMTRRIIAIATKEFRHIMRDWQTLMVILLMPVLMMFLFGYALTLDLIKVPGTRRRPVSLAGKRRGSPRRSTPRRMFRVIGTIRIGARPGRNFQKAPCEGDLPLRPALCRGPPDAGRRRHRAGAYRRFATRTSARSCETPSGPLVQKAALDALGIKQPRS